MLIIPQEVDNQPITQSSVSQVLGKTTPQNYIDPKYWMSFLFKIIDFKNKSLDILGVTSWKC